MFEFRKKKNRTILNNLLQENLFKNSSMFQITEYFYMMENSVMKELNTGNKYPSHNTFP